MAEIVTDLASGATYTIFETEALSAATSEHTHPGVHADDDHGHDEITSFDVASGSADTLAVNVLHVNDLQVIDATLAALSVSDQIGASVVNATTANVDTLLAEDVEAYNMNAHTAQIGRNLYYRDALYEISDKFHKTGNETALADETDTTAPTLVVRDRATGCRVTNLAVRTDNSAGYTGTFPGLFFDQGTCSTKFSLVDDGQTEFMPVDNLGEPIAGEYTRLGWLGAGIHGLDVSRAGDGQTLVRGGTVQIEAGTGQTDAAPTTCLAITATNQSDLQLIIDSRGTQHFYRDTMDSDVPILVMRELDGTMRWVINAQGKMEHVTHSADDPTHAFAGSAPATSVDSVAVGDNSLYVGSAKLSFDRAANKLTFKRLKLTGLPKYFTDLGHNNTTLPSGYNLAAMSVQRYLALARDLESDDTLHLKEVFPVANDSQDWEDAGDLFTGTIPTAVTEMSDMSHAGSGQVITAVERTAIGTLQTDVAALQGGSSANLLVNNASGTASITIQSDTDTANASSTLTFFADSNNVNEDRTWTFLTDPGASDGLVLNCVSTGFGTKECMRFNPAGRVSFGAGGNAITNLNVAAFQVREDAWFRSTVRTSGDIYLDPNCTVRRSDANGDDLLAGGSSGPTSFFYSGHNASYTLTAEHRDVMWTRHLTQNQEGGAITFVLPATPADGSDLHINIHSFQNHVTLDQVGGTIYLQKDNSHTFSPLSHDDPIVKSYTWDKIYLTATDRSSFSATLDGGTGVWYVKAYADRRKIHHNAFTKHFDKLVNTYNTEATAFELPLGYQRYEISIGDGLAQDPNTDFDVYFKPPATAALGTRIECLQLHPSHLNSCGGLYVVNVDVNHDHILPGGTTATSPAYLSQSSNGRKRHVLIKTGATRWTQHRTM
jgi:hypothetical protein